MYLYIYINIYYTCIQMGLHHGHTAGNAVSDRYLRDAAGAVGASPRRAYTTGASPRAGQRRGNQSPGRQSPLMSSMRDPPQSPLAASPLPALRENSAHMKAPVATSGGAARRAKTTGAVSAYLPGSGHELEPGLVAMNGPPAESGGGNFSRQSSKVTLLTPSALQSVRRVDVCVWPCLCVCVCRILTDGMSCTCTHANTHTHRTG